MSTHPNEHRMYSPTQPRIGQAGSTPAGCTNSVPTELAERLHAAILGLIDEAESRYFSDGESAGESAVNAFQWMRESVPTRLPQIIAALRQPAAEQAVEWKGSGEAIAFNGSEYLIHNGCNQLLNKSGAWVSPSELTSKNSHEFFWPSRAAARQFLESLKG